MFEFRRVYSRMIVETSIEADVAALAPRLRRADVDEVRYFNGAAAETELHASYRNAKLCFTLKDVEGQPMAMFGVGWSQNPRAGRIWLLSTDFIYSVGKPFLFHCPYYVNILMQGHDVLFNYVHDGNLASVKWLRWLGFESGARYPELGSDKKPFTEFVKFKDEFSRAIYLDRNWKSVLAGLEAA